LRCKPIVGVQRVMIHRDHAKQMIVGLGDGLAWPVAIYVANYKIFEGSAKGAFVNGHVKLRYTLSYCYCPVGVSSSVLYMPLKSGNGNCPVRSRGA